MARIEEDWEPFEIEVPIEGEPKAFLVIPEREEPTYKIFEQHTYLGVMWLEHRKTGKIWCGEGMVVKALALQLGEQIESYLSSKPV